MSAFFSWQPVPGNTSSTTTLNFDIVMTENPQFPNQVAEHVVEVGADVTDNVRVGLQKLTLEVFVTNEPIQLGNQWGTGSTQQLAISTPDASGQPINSGEPVLTAKEMFTLPIGVPIIGALATQPQDEPFSPDIGLRRTFGTSTNAQTVQFSSTFDAVQQTHDLLLVLRNTGQPITVVGSKGTYENLVIQSFEMLRNAEQGSGAQFTIEMTEIRQAITSTVTAPTPTVARGQSSVSHGSQSTDQPSDGTTQSVLSFLQGLFSGTTVPTP